MSVTIPEILAHYSPLGYSAGDVLSTGTVSGVAGFSEDAAALPKPGDVMEAEIERSASCATPSSRDPPEPSLIVRSRCQADSPGYEPFAFLFRRGEGEERCQRERGLLMKRTRLLLATAGLALFMPFAAAAAGSWPSHIALPNGFRPEGIAIGPGHTFYVGSIPTGAVVRGDLRRGPSILCPRPGRTSCDRSRRRQPRATLRGRRADGHGFVYDANTGANIADYDFTTGDPPTFVNDVVVTHTAVWFADSVRPFLYRIDIAPNGTLGGATAVPLTGDIAYEADST